VCANVFYLYAFLKEISEIKSLAVKSKTYDMFLGGESDAEANEVLLLLRNGVKVWLLKKKGVHLKAQCGPTIQV